jgi:hypothetical protein
VTLVQGPSTAVTESVGNGFNSPNPLDPLDPTPPLAPSSRGTSCPKDADFADCGPSDLGAAFDFEFPRVPPGGQLRFWLYYGAFPDEAAALAGLDTVGASALTLGQSSHLLGPDSSSGGARSHGAPITFVLGFQAPWAIIDNGTVELGIDMFSALNVHGGTPPPGGPLAPPEGVEIPITGLRNVATNHDGLEFGDPREGWGVADLTQKIGSGTTSLVGFTGGGGPGAPVPEGGVPPVPGFNMSPVDFDVFGAGTLPESVGRRAVVTTSVGDPAILRVTHDYRPSASPNLYEVIVVLENLTGSPIDPRYRRIADWDVLGIASEDDLVTIAYGKGSPVSASEGGGFVSPNPLDSMSDPFSPCANDVPLLDCGPGEIGMALDFELDTIPAGGREQFHLYYGSAFGDGAALTALAAVGAEVYSIAEEGSLLAPEAPPPVFVFGMKDVLFVDGFETSDTSRWSAAVP